MIPIYFILFWRSAALQLQLFVNHISTNTIDFRIQIQAPLPAIKDNKSSIRFGSNVSKPSSLAMNLCF